MFVALVLLVLSTAAVVGAWIWLESDAAAAYLRRTVEERTSAALDRAVRVGRLELDLVPFRARLDEVEIAGIGPGEPAFLAVDRVEMSIAPWALLSRRVVLSTVALLGPRLHVDLHPDGSSNVPSLPRTAAGGGFDLRVDRLTLSDGHVELNHEPADLDADLGALDIETRRGTAGLPAILGGTTLGTLRVGSGALILRPHRPGAEGSEAGAATAGGSSDGEVRLEPLAVDLVFTLTPDDLRVDDLTIEVADSRVHATGSVHRWDNGQLSLDGTLRMSEIARVVRLPGPDVQAGEIALDGTLRYTRSDGVTLDGRFESPGLNVAALPLSALRGEVRASRTELALTAVDAAVFEGTVRADVGVALDDEPDAWTLRYAATDVDLARLTTWEAMRGFRFAGRADASGELSWAGPWRRTVSGSGALELRVRGESLGATTPAPAGGAGPSGARGPASTPAATVPPPGPRAAEQTGDTSPPTAVPSLPLPINATFRYGLGDGVLRLEEGRASLPDTDVAVGGEVDLDGRLAITLAIRSADLRMLDRVFTQLRRYRGEAPVPLPLGIVGRGTIDATLRGTVAEPEVAGTLSAEQLVVAGNPVGSVLGSLRLSGSMLQVDDLEVQRGDGLAEGRGRFRVGRLERAAPTTDYELRMSMRDYPLEARLERWAVPLEVRGPATGTVALAGDYGSAPTGTVAAQSRRFELNGVGPFAADLRVDLDPGRWRIEHLELNGEPGALDVSGDWNRVDDTLSARLSVRRLDAASLGSVVGRALPFGGRLGATVDLSGPLSSPDATATLRWSEASAWDIPVGEIAASATLDGGLVRAALVGAGETTTPSTPVVPEAAPAGTAPELPSVPAAGWAATLTVDPEPPGDATARAAGELRWARALLAARGIDLPPALEVDGGMALEGRGTLDDWRSWTVSARLEAPRLAMAGVTISAPEPVSLEVEDARLTLRVPSLVHDEGSLRGHAVVDLESRSWLDGRADGELDLAALQMLDDRLRSSGRVEGSIVASGEVSDTVVEGDLSLTDATVGWSDWPYRVDDLDGRVRLAAGRLELLDLSGVVAGRTFTLDGEVPLDALASRAGGDPVDVGIHVDDLPLAPLLDRAPALHRLVTDGSASVTARFNGYGVRWRDYRGTVNLRALDVQLGDLPVGLVAATTLDLAGGRLTLATPAALRGAGTDLRVSGSFDVSPLVLALRVRGLLNLDPLDTLSENVGIAGSAQVDIGLSGTPPDLLYDGTADLSGGLISPQPLRQPLEDIRAHLVFEERRVRIERFDGRLGGGDVGGDGELLLRDSRPQTFDLRVSVEEALLRLDRDVRVTVTADLVHEGTPARSLLSGDLTVEEGQYRKEWNPGDPILQLTGAPGGGGPATVEPLFATVNLDIAIEAPEEMRVDNNVADLEMRADLELRGTLLEPVLLGRAVVLAGDVYWRGNTYQIIQGTVEFQNPIRTEPTFDVRAETVLRQYAVTLNFSGSIERGMQFSYASSPPLSDIELFRLLALGQAPTTSGADDPTFGSVGLQASRFLTAQYLGEVERGAQRVFGLDRFRIEPTILGSQADPTARVTVGEQITPNVLVTYSTVLGSSEEQLFVIEYQVTRGIRVVGTREEDGSFGLDFRFDHRF